MERDKTKRIMVRLEEPSETQVTSEPDIDPSDDDFRLRTYRVETTLGEVEGIEKEIYETVNKARRKTEIDGIILDAERYGKLQAYYHDQMESSVDSRWNFPIFAVHVDGSEVCEALYSETEKMAEEFVSDYD